MTKSGRDVSTPVTRRDEPVTHALTELAERYPQRELICSMLVLFIETSVSGWVSLTIDEGISKFELETSVPGLSDINEIADEFAYPVKNLHELTHYTDKKLTALYEYRIKGIEEGCIGLYFDCGDCGFSVLEINGCLSIVDSLYKDFEDEVILVKMPPQH